MAELLIKCIIGYFLGSVSGSLILGKFTGVDIRNSGSGNAGGTNALRTQGLKFGIAVLIIDIGKGFLAGWGLSVIPFPASATAVIISQQQCAMIYGSAAILGHVYPIYFRFKGGKGAGTLVGVILGIQPGLILPTLAVWLTCVLLSGYVGISTILAAVSVPILENILYGSESPPLFILFASCWAAFILLTHRSNILRMMNGTENRFEKLWLLGRFLKKP